MLFYFKYETDIIYRFVCLFVCLHYFAVFDIIVVTTFD